MQAIGNPQLGERWRYRDGGGTAIEICEITDRVVRYFIVGYPATVFGERHESWHEKFEPAVKSQWGN